jgi:hypothetical protein
MSYKDSYKFTHELVNGWTCNITKTSSTIAHGQINRTFTACKNGINMVLNPYLQLRDQHVTKVLLHVEELGLKQAAYAL